MNTTKGLPIGSAAKETGLSEDTLRYYERIGLLPKVERESSGHRRYNGNDVEWLRFITRMREAGMSIELLQRYATLLAEGESTWAERRQILTEHRAVVHEKIAQLQGSLDVIDWKLGRMDDTKC